MEKQPGLGGGLLGTYTPSDPSMNVPLTASPNAAMSPYLNFDPAYIMSNPESQFIFPEGSNHKRGRFELAFSQIGGSVMAGGAVGGVNGFYTGIQETKAAQLSGALWRSQMLNFINKQGASSAQALGVIAVLYSAFGVGFSKLRGDVDDEINTVLAGTSTGLLFKSTGGLRACMKGGAIGLTVASVYSLWSGWERIRGFMGRGD
ncbi:hypothetical protein CAPTEDRAFT_227448 [Capitella teleta]|uniref:Mitochondrial import inner membrane translocase subunit TIM23 n=1 Tax=Capitella teleta TaxID=283909 RepID=R7V1K5_CAPTE|nr:hypothetical protein CAPTEDRAFT_148443 [Capitella teleta]ELU09546.1 hypothetical protein CAPTEDRAFT_227448 [Capitella teleta]|eukprot:ELT96009.1 hypothetical protein CAPTEDRAFT_148443 [Capitella teleta]